MAIATRHCRRQHRFGWLRLPVGLALLAVTLAPAAGLWSAPVRAADSKAASSDMLVVVLKSDRILYIYRNGLPIRSFPVALGGNPVGDKHESGDQRTPVGSYTLDWRNPNSLFYKAIHISYPDVNDILAAVRRGVNPGGEIEIHGQPSYDNRKRKGDWTHGCIAVSDHAMDEIWKLVPDGTPIHIYP